MLLKVVHYYGFIVLSMSVMSLKKNLWIGGVGRWWGISSIHFFYL